MPSCLCACCGLGADVLLGLLSVNARAEWWVNCLLLVLNGRIYWRAVTAARIRCCFGLGDRVSEYISGWCCAVSLGVLFIARTGDYGGCCLACKHVRNVKTGCNFWCRYITPRKVPALSGVSISAVAVGEQHFLALSGALLLSCDWSESRVVSLAPAQSRAER